MFRSYEIKGVNVPKYHELKVGTFWKIIKENPIYLSYFPDYKEGKLPQWQYMFDLLYTIDESFVANLIQDCHLNRRIEPNFVINECGEIRTDLMKEIMNSYHYSRKIELLVYIV